MDTCRSLEHLLEYEGNDVEDTFSLTFEITREVFGQIQHIELIPNGAKTLVTSATKKDYVNAYLDYVFNKSVEEKFHAFYIGFHRVAGGRVLVSNNLLITVFYFILYQI